ncbi:MAG: ATP-dependent phosphofructokinase / diphosphate-dependent phosphofructokinase [Clostridiales bacterium]|nr:ATP-dependent phosphofructokinase / diphosphate-dependent phosphofructokinase [Clostridiales bacterium]
MKKRVAILTGGGDCAGLNAAIRAVAIRLLNGGYEVIGIKQGWKGLLEKIAEPIDKSSLEDVLSKGGTFLETSRTNIYKTENGLERTKNNFADLGLEAIVAIGGEDTLGVAGKLYEDGLPVVGIPKTMDNDVGGTDYCIGFDTSVSISVDAVEKLRDTAKSHRRNMVLEVMGRHAGWVALYTGIASGADWVFVPEVEPNFDDAARAILKKRKRGQNYAVVVASEGITLDDGAEVEIDSFGHKRVSLRGVGEKVAREIEEKTGIQTRSSAIGYVQRGGPPTVFDRILATRFGYLAAELVMKRDFGKMTAMVNGDIIPVDISLASQVTTVSTNWYKFAEEYFNEK